MDFGALDALTAQVRRDLEAPAASKTYVLFIPTRGRGWTVRLIL